MDLKLESQSGYKRHANREEFHSLLRPENNTPQGERHPHATRNFTSSLRSQNGRFWVSKTIYFFISLIASEMINILEDPHGMDPPQLLLKDRHPTAKNYRFGLRAADRNHVARWISE